MNDSVGEILRKTRLKNNKSLEEAALSTHIRIEYLTALENDQRNLLPSEVQAKGFLRLYADYLGLPVDLILSKWSGKDIDIIVDTDQQIPEINGSSAKEDNPVESNIETTQSASHLNPPPVETIIDTNISESQRIYLEIGLTLKQQRESLGLSLDEVENYTHIRKHYLEAIENGRMDHLPSSVQGRGMLNNYAKFLQLDPDIIMLKYADGLQSRLLEKPSDLPIQQKRQVKEKTKKTKPTYRRLLTPDLIVGGLMIIILFGVIFYSLTQVLKPTAQANKSTQPSISELLISTPSFMSEIGQEAITETINQVGTDSTLDTSDQPLFSTTSTSIPRDNPINIQIIANQRAWVRIIADNKEVFNKRVVPGNVYQFSASNRLDLISGNAGALQLIYNQQDLGTLGIVGQVVNITFSKEGIQTPTSLPSPTSSPTVPPTPTATGPTPTQAPPTATPFIP